MAARKGKPKKKGAKMNSFMKPITPDAALAAIVGSKAIPRTQVTKKTWAYIKRKKLQDKKKRIMINPDALLGKVCGGKKQVSMFELTKWVSRHLKA
ncbi:MAG: SWIB/MDM2 domain-containing protein [Pseudomonadota bacterium]